MPTPVAGAMDDDADTLDFSPSAAAVPEAVVTVTDCCCSLTPLDP
jgi:hypothetical protein